MSAIPEWMGKPLHESAGHQKSIEDWQDLLRKELKVSDIDGIVFKEKQPGIKLSILAHRNQQSVSDTHFGRPALSHTFWSCEELNASNLKALYQAGVQDFLLDLSEPDIFFADQKATDFFVTHAVPLYLSGPMAKVLNYPEWVRPVLHAKECEWSGGDVSTELGLLLCRVVHALEKNPHQRLIIESWLSPQLMQSVAKIKALKAMLSSLFHSMNLPEREDYWLIGRTSLRHFSLLDEENNILRNTLIQTAAHLSGVNQLECLSYDCLHKKTSDQNWWALSGKLILETESFLSSVEDPMGGSFIVEEYAHQVIESSWKSMQMWVNLSSDESTQKAMKVARLYGETLKRKMRTRKIIQSGVNDYPNPKEKFSRILLPLFKNYLRLSSEFEDLRREALSVASRKSLTLLVYGDYAKLSQRVNFSRNFFELIGLNVNEVRLNDLTSQSLLDRKLFQSELWVACASDTDYPEMIKLMKTASMNRFLFVAGKYEDPEVISFHAGVDTLEVLGPLVNALIEKDFV